MLLRLRSAFGQIATQSIAALVQILHLRRVVGWFVKRQISQLLIRNWNVEAIAEGLDVLVRHFFRLVRGVLSFRAFAHAITLDGFGQNHCRLTGVRSSFVESRINLVRIVTATVQAPDLLIRHLGNHF